MIWRAAPSTAHGLNHGTNLTAKGDFEAPTLKGTDAPSLPEHRGPESALRRALNGLLTWTPAWAQAHARSHAR